MCPEGVVQPADSISSFPGPAAPGRVGLDASERVNMTREWGKDDKHLAASWGR
jgi:hypothetical protein